MWAHPSDRGVLAGGVAVELGCGPQKRRPAADGSVQIGVDIDEISVHEAADGSVGWFFVCADARALPFRPGACSSIHLRAVLHHLPPVRPVLDELADALVEGGQLTIVDGVSMEPSVVAELVAELDRSGIAGEPVYGFDVDDLAADVRRAGFVVESVEIDGVATFATPPYVSRDYATDRFVLTAAKR